MTDLNNYDWIERLQEPIQVDVRSQGDEWLDHLHRRITQTTGSTEFRFRSESPFGHLHTPSGGTLGSSLLVQAGDNRPICCVVGTGQKRPEDIGPWVDAIDYAVAQLGTNTTFPWWAAIGEDPDYPVAPTLQLASRCIIGNIELYPSEELFFELRPQRSLTSTHTAWTFPVQVRGSSIGYAWNAASQQAVTDLKIMCSLLSLASGRIWRLRQSPQLALSIPDGSPIEDVPKLPKYSIFFPVELQREDNYGEPTSFDVPQWVNDAWPKIQGDRELMQLVATYHESLILEAQNHDSYGLLATVAVVEAIGNRTHKKLSRCHECRNVTGSTERFRSALRRVMDHDSAADLARIVYGQRSKTAHNGALHGAEFIIGAYTGPSIMSENPPVEFGYTARMLRNAAAKLLRLELTSG